MCIRDSNRLGGGCQVPIGAFAEIRKDDRGGKLHFEAIVADPKILLSILMWVVYMLSLIHIWYPGKLILILCFPGATSRALPGPSNSAM